MKFLTEHPDEIINAWRTPLMHEAGCLFMFCSPSHGCLTQVKCGQADAMTPEL